LRCRANGSNTVNGQTKAIRVHGTANSPMRLDMADAIGGITLDVTGTITITLEYRAGSAGTVTARNATLAAMIYRTA
jgi:hypothetical protein